MIAVILRVDYELKVQRQRVLATGGTANIEIIGPKPLLEDAKADQLSKRAVSKQKLAAAPSVVTDISHYSEELVEEEQKKLKTKKGQHQSKTFDQAKAKRKLNRESI